MTTEHTLATEAPAGAVTVSVFFQNDPPESARRVRINPHPDPEGSWSVRQISDLLQDFLWDRMPAGDHGAPRRDADRVHQLFDVGRGEFVPDDDDFTNRIQDGALLRLDNTSIGGTP